MLTGWSCCKPRVLTFDEFLSIPPCTTGKHSTTDLPPSLPKKTNKDDADAPRARPVAAASVPGRAPIAPAEAPQASAATPPPADTPTSDDDAALPIPIGKACRRRACGYLYEGKDRAEEKCIFHPGAPIFHEGTKGYTCCKRRVLEFDEFLRLEGCETKPRHLFVGSGGKRKKNSGGDASGGAANDGEEKLETVRHDFYQTPSTLHASFFLKKIDKDASTVGFPTTRTMALDLVTKEERPKRWTVEIPLFGTVDADKCQYKILGTKLEVELAKSDGVSWPTLRSDERGTGEIIQTGRAGRA